MTLDLPELGDQLETAIARRARRRPARLLASAATAILAVAVVITVGAASSDPPAAALPATVVAHVPVQGPREPTPDPQLAPRPPGEPRPPGHVPTSPDEAGAVFADQVLRHLPAASGRSSTCSTIVPDRYDCQVIDTQADDPQVTATEVAGDPSRFLFRDETGLAGGACEVVEVSPTRLICATNTVAVDAGLLSSEELEQLTGG